MRANGRLVSSVSPGNTTQATYTTPARFCPRDLIDNPMPLDPRDVRHITAGRNGLKYPQVQRTADSQDTTPERRGVGQSQNRVSLLCRVFPLESVLVIRS